MTLHRGVKLNLVELDPDRYSKGKICTFMAFSSCTTEIETLENPMYLGTTGKRTIIQFSTNSAVLVQGYSAFPNEAEAIIPPGRSFRVVSQLKLGNGLVMIQLADSPHVPSLIVQPATMSATAGVTTGAETQV